MQTAAILARVYLITITWQPRIRCWTNYRRPRTCPCLAKPWGYRGKHAGLARHDPQILALACHLGRRKTGPSVVVVKNNNNNNDDDVVARSFWEAGYSALTCIHIKI